MPGLLAHESLCASGAFSGNSQKSALHLFCTSTFSGELTLGMLFLFSLQTLLNESDATLLLDCVKKVRV